MARSMNFPANLISALKHPFCPIKIRCFMRKILLLILCVGCLVLCACVPNQEPADPPQTPAATQEPKPSPGMTIVPPSETPVEIIDPADPSEDPVVMPLETPVDTSDETPEPTPGATTGPTPGASVEPTSEPTSGGVDLPYVPVAPIP